MSVRVLEGHVVDVLEHEPAGTYHVCVTSPPYLWLRSYSTAPQTWPDGWVGELGQEPDPETYVAHLVACFRAVRRVLRDDGTLWVNLAGCYYNDPGGQNGARLRNGQGSTTWPKVGGAKGVDLHAISQKTVRASADLGRQKRGKHPWLRPLDWVDVPGLFARGMQQDGWLWRSDVTWVKPSALPESVSGTRWERCRVSVRPTPRSSEPSKGASPHGPQSVGLMAANTTRPNNPTTLAAREALAEWADCTGCPRCAPDGYVLRRGNGRPTKSTERVLLFIKWPGAFFDADAVREPHQGHGPEHYGVLTAAPHKFDPTGEARKTINHHAAARQYHPAGRNLRDWWVLSPEPISDAHYAAYPTALPDRCIRAGTSEWGCCPACGAPWARVVDRSSTPGGVFGVPGKWHLRDAEAAAEHRGQHVDPPETTTLGWRPTCRCPGATEPPVPCRVLDCFGGSGATALAANRLGRDCTLVELKPAYAALARKRIGREPLSLFASLPEEVPV